jgi:hypothetical protein
MIVHYLLHFVFLLALASTLAWFVYLARVSDHD